MSQTTATFRTCPLCEATCGLEVGVRDGAVTRIRGDRDDVFSKGFICPKGSTLKQLHDDPDRLRAPVVRRGDRWEQVSWEEAWRVVEAGLRPVIEQHGGDAVAAYLGNPNVHTMAGPLYLKPLLTAIGTKNIFSAATVDQMPKHVSSGLMFGHPDSIPVPDIDRTDYLLMLGADPLESNGSLATAPDWPGRIRALQERGGKLVVVDPRRSRTAREADRHLFIRPGTDALLLLAIVAVLFEEGLTAPGRLSDLTNGIAEVASLAARFSPEAVAERCGVAADTIRRIARELAAAPTAVVYGRIGTHTVEFGTVASWLADVINVLIGGLDAPGGAMFPLAAHARPPRPGRPFRTGRWTSRVRGLPEVRGELPVATLADEIETPGEGRVRALVTVAGNPVLSTPDGARLDRALASLDFMVSVDFYINETTRHADVILPPPPPLAREHYDFAFYQLSVRNIANYSPPTLSRNGEMEEWEILTRLALIASGQGAGADPALADGWGIATTVNQAISGPDSPISGRDPEEILGHLNQYRGPARILDYLLRTGPYGDRFGEDPDGLSLAKLVEHPHGIDLGPLQPRLPGLLTTASGKIELAPAQIMEEAARLATTLERPPQAGLVLVGRRHLRSNNSWMHNLEVLIKGKERCTLLMHPNDAFAAGVQDGENVKVSNRTGAVTARVTVTEDIMAGVVSLPHGWGHHVAGTQLSVAARRPGVNSNLLTSAETLDPLSGNAVLNGIPVTVSRA
ncbi:MAG TPA: molybdopterin-dependent oxidoreductase [Acidimicrobiia bacterium]|nr:molybdopterin-dependent oxidoreductase [Acidimicrobiia bacterium]